MMFELKLGTLIRKLNPYTNGRTRTMDYGPVPPVNPTLAAALLVAAQENQAHIAAPAPATLVAAQAAEDLADNAMDFTEIDLVVDNDYRQEYMTWTFRGRPHAVKRALRIQYRYELMDRAGRPTGVYAAEHVLIGYAGSNG